MTARYHPIVDTLWDDEALEGMPFEGKAFFCFLCSNRRLRPSGIYRVTDEQLAVDTGMTLARVRKYLGDLMARGRICRDGAWIFVRGYFGRQPQQPRLVLGVQSDLADCSSVCILKSFGEKYPLLSKWSTERLQTVNRTRSEIVSTEQSRAVQSRAEQSSAIGSGDTPPSPGARAGTSNGQPQAEPAVAFQIPASVVTSLARCRILGQVAKLRDPLWWQAELRANPTVDLAKELLRAEAWIASNPDRAPRSNHARFLHNWFGRATEGR